MADKFRLGPNFHAANLQRGANGFTSLPKEGKDFYARKNPTASAGFEPANSGTRGQHARPPKPLRMVMSGE
jgi:hypothetical protein